MRNFTNTYEITPFSDEKYDEYKGYLLEACRTSSAEQVHAHQTAAAHRADPYHRAWILALQDYCLNEDEKLYRKATPTEPEKVVLRDWQL